MLDGRVDAVMGAFRNYEVIEAEELGMAVRTFELADHGVPPFYQLVFVARDGMERDRSAAVGAVLARVALGIARTRADPAGTYADYLRANPAHADRFHERAFAATVGAFAATQHMDAARWTDFAAFLRDRGLLDRVPTAADLFTNELAA